MTRSARISEETSLGFQTVRTIVDRGDGVDRASRKQLQRIEPDRARVRAWLAKRQSRKALPRRAAVEKANAELRTSPFWSPRLYRRAPVLRGRLP